MAFSGVFDEFFRPEASSFLVTLIVIFSSSFFRLGDTTIDPTIMSAPASFKLEFKFRRAPNEVLLVDDGDGLCTLAGEDSSVSESDAVATFSISCARNFDTF